MDHFLFEFFWSSYSQTVSNSVSRVRPTKIKQTTTICSCFSQLVQTKMKTTGLRARTLSEEQHLNKDLETAQSKVAPTPFERATRPTSKSKNATATTKTTEENLTTPSTSPTTTTSSSTLQQIIIATLFVLTVSSIYFLNHNKRRDINEPVSIGFVASYGWITAVSTGFGIVPFLFTTQELSQRWLGIANAIAAGMMLTASGTLAYEGYHAEDNLEEYLHEGILCSYRMILGFLFGIAFILFIKWLLDGGDFDVGELQGADARRALLVMAVMTLHSFAEGVGIGVAFSRQKGGHELGSFISLSLAIHNVPEGLAVAVVLIPRGVSLLSTAGWSIFSSIPQPLVAIPVYMFVSAAIPWLPVGLGFASGAMLYVAFFELLPEAKETIGIIKTLFLTMISGTLMISLQRLAAAAAATKEDQIVDIN